MRYELISFDGSIKNCYMYFPDWESFLVFYQPINPRKKHFYEMFNDKIKFFLDIDDIQSNFTDNTWNELINKIMYNLKIFIIK